MGHTSDISGTTDSSFQKTSDGATDDPKSEDVYVLEHDGEQEEHRMLIYEAVEGIPIGLEPLLEVTSVSFTTGLPLSVSFDVTVNRHYNVANQSGQKVYHVGENTNHCVDYCCNGHRQFKLHFFNGRGRTVMTVTQECTFCLGCSSAECAGANIVTKLTDGSLVGTVKQRYNLWWPRYEIRDFNGDIVMCMSGPGGGVWTQICGRKFIVSLCHMTYGKRTQAIAMIDRRTCVMPEDLSVQNKALLLSAVFLVELDYYQSSRTYSKALAILAVIFILLLLYAFGVFYKS
ncbi:unnamed protein product [Allacma fusca]|uniref:Phospholipid scramblase n=1 Tax=Allacma fusca TaxID=39272 RepID=A0A8J2J5G0_9HEXA|nr:unnamed protein product [Allacma fusca]